MTRLRVFMYLLISLCSLGSFARSAQTYFFDGSQASGTEKLGNLSKVEFVIIDSGSKLRMCGLWELSGEQKLGFNHLWDLKDSEVWSSGKNIGSFFNGNFLIEQVLGPGRFLSIDITRFDETFFEFSFHDPALGFADADGWIRETGSDELKQNCEGSL